MGKGIPRCELSTDLLNRTIKHLFVKFEEIRVNLWRALNH